VDSSAVLVDAAASARQARAGDNAGALASAEEGLARYGAGPGGDPGTGDPGIDDPVAALRADRAPTYRSLRRTRALALSRLGRRAEAVDALAAAVEQQPRDEEVLLELLRCEAATLGPAAALARYEAYRAALRDELGADPGAALQALHRELLQDGRPRCGTGWSTSRTRCSAAPRTSPR
jgi:tetratricopeptide (TPR) repeat protein